MKKRQKGRGIMTIMALIVMLSFGCAGLQPITKEGAGLMSMNSWDDQKAVFETEVAMPDLSEDFKKILRIKREILIGSFYSIKMYNEYIEFGFVTAETLTDLYTKYINIAEIPFEEIVEIYKRYVETGELDAIVLEQVIDMMIAQLTAMALSRMFKTALLKFSGFPINLMFSLIFSFKFFLDIISCFSL